MSYLLTDRLLDRCREVIGLGSGMRPLDAWRLRPEYHAGLTEREQSVRSLVNPRYDVRVIGLRAIGASGVQARVFYEVKVEVRCAYHLEQIHRLSAATRDDVLGLVVEDCDRLTQALGFVDNLSRTTNGYPTRLVGGVLMPSGSTVKTDVGDENNRRVIATHEFTGTLETNAEDVEDISTIAGLVAMYRSDVVSGSELAITDGSDFSAAAWTKVNSTVTANADTDSEGASTVDRITNTGTSGQHYAQQTTTAGSGFGFITFQVDLKPGTAQYAWLGNVADSVYQTFDLTNGRVGSTTSNVVAASMEPIANGLYRCRLAWYVETSAAVGVGVSLTDSVASYSGGGEYIGACNASISNYNTVSTWDDQVGSRDLVMSTLSAMPRLLYAKGAGVMNGNEVLQFKPAAPVVRLEGQTAADWTFLHDGTGSTIAMACHRLNNVSGANASLYFDNTNNASVFPGVNAVRNLAGSVSARVFNDSTFATVTVQGADSQNECLIYRYSSSGSPNFAFEINGRSGTVTSFTPSANPPTFAFTLGQANSGFLGTAGMNGYFAEVRIYNQFIADTDAAKIRRYYGHRYGTA